MAVLISAATGNWLTAATWKLADSTSYLNSETSNSALTASYVTSSTFTPGAITIDGIAVKLASRAASPTGTISVALDQATTTVTGTEVVLNVSDLPTAGTTAMEGGFILFKFASPVTLTAATAYGVKAKTSSTSQANLYSSATTNWARALRTTTTQAPTTGDDTIVAGEHTGAGTGNDLTVTMNETAATDYGSNTTSTVTPALSICKRGTLTFNDASAANPKLRLSGHLVAYNGGTLNIGTVATPIPRNSTAILEFDCAADGDFGLVARNGSALNLQGLSRTSGKNVCKCLLAANASASGGAPSTSTLTVDTDSGWLSGDQIAVASTSRTASDCETGTLNADAGVSSIVVVNMTAGAAGMAVPPTSNRGLLVAHSGTSPTQAEIILLTRNVKLRSTSATAMSFVSLLAGSSVDVDWVEFYFLGENATGKRGVEVECNTTGNVNVSIQYSSIHDCEDFGLYYLALNTATIITTAVFSYNTMWNMATVSGVGCQVFSSGIAATNWTIDNNVLIRIVGGSGWTLADVGGSFTNNTVVGALTFGININEGAAIGTCNENTSHSNTSAGFNMGATGTSGTVGDLVCWRNNAAGILISGPCSDMIFDVLTLFGNVTYNIQCNTFGGEFSVKSGNSSGDTSFATPIGVGLTQSGSSWSMVLDGCNFSTVAGIKTAHSTADISVIGTSVFGNVTARNSVFGAASEVASQSNMSSNGYIASQKHDQTAGNHRTWMKNGTIQTDSTTYNTAAPSILMTPTSASLKLESAPQFQGLKVAVNNGAAATVACYVRKSATYNGNQPRLIQKANPALGQDSDVVLATYAGGTGSWAQISGTTSTPTDDGAWEIVVDCDGSAGAVNVDDFTVS